MIVCLDGSSSMAGEKEIWSKAVALTLLEIARRQRRRFRFVCFSSPETPLFTLDLNPRDHHLVREDRALDVAEYFPGGGTDFETPLDAALETLAAARYRRGDVVLITDGECRVSPEWLRALPAREAPPRLLALLGPDRRRPEQHRDARRAERPGDERVAADDTAARDLFVSL